MDTLKRVPRPLSGLFFALALGALGALLIADSWHHFQPSVLHQKAGSLALMLVGLSFICLQANPSSGWMETVKGVLLGLAFVLWGSEQFLPRGSLVTAVDSAVITIFVVDLGLVILGRLRSDRGPT